jgi:hypothetical protein
MVGRGGRREGRGGGRGGGGVMGGKGKRGGGGKSLHCNDLKITYKITKRRGSSTCREHILSMRTL